MFVYLLTGIWYEPGSKVFKLLETLEYRWMDVLPRLLSENPADRPTNLKELAEGLGQRASRPLAQDGESAVKSNGRDARSTKRRVALVVAGAAVLVAAAVGYFIFTYRSASSATDDFDAVFGARGIYGKAQP